MSDARVTKTGGREATQGVIPGKFALSVGKPELPAPKGWEWVKLTDVARLETGHTPSRKHPEYWNGEIPWIGIKDATSNHGRIIDDTFQHVTQTGIENSSARILPAKTVCLSRTASVGYVVVMNKPMATSQDFVNWVCSEKIDYRYLAAILFAENSSYSLFSRGTTHQTIYFPEVKAFHVLLPPIEQQGEIADIIWSINKKIELNRQTNQILEQIAQAIFKSWFVDFDPVRAKIAARESFIQQHPEVTEAAIRAAASSEGDTLAHAGAKASELAAICAISGKTEEQLNELDANTLQQLRITATLFPNALVESEHGEAPEGWDYGTLSEIGSFGDERTAVSELSLENYISTENMLEGKRGITKAASLPSVKTVPAFKKGHILISNIRPYFMKIWLAQFEGGRSNDVLGIETEDQKSTEFLYNLLFQDTFFNFMMMTSKGAKMPRGDKDAIMAWKLPVPDREIRRKYASTVKDFYVLAESLNNENKFLGQLRDTLLPKLLSGEVHLQETQPILEATM